MLKTLSTQCDLLCVQFICVCNVAHELVSYKFCAIVMCDSNIYTQQIASTPIAPYEQSRKITCKNMLLHAEQITPCERDFRVSSHKAIAIIMQLV